MPPNTAAVSSTVKAIEYSCIVMDAAATASITSV